MTTFFMFSTNSIRHFSTSMTSWQKIFCMRIARNQYASHTKTWLLVVANFVTWLHKMRMVTCGDWAKKLRERAKNDDHSVITPPPMNQS